MTLLENRLHKNKKNGLSETIIRTKLRFAVIIIVLPPKYDIK